jgi:hypothetical protein
MSYTARERWQRRIRGFSLTRMALAYGTHRRWYERAPLVGDLLLQARIDRIERRRAAALVPERYS